MADTQKNLAADYEIFESHRSEWAKQHEGQFVVMHKGEVLGFFDDYASGLRAGIAKFGAKNEFLVQQVSEEELVLAIY
jgi:hypothetical protein